MAAAPKNGILTFKGDSGRVYTYSAYFSDVNATFATFNLTKSAGTGDTNFLLAPENITLIDASVPTGLTDTTSGTLVLNDAIIPNSLIAWAPIVNTLPTRTFPVWRISGGRKVQIVQNT